MTTAITRAAFTGLALCLFGCSKRRREGRGARALTVAAATVTVRPQAFTETLGAIGTVVSRAGHAATLSAPAAGRSRTFS
jgi:hypothetical protein